jgi:hypothetical protein
LIGTMSCGQAENAMMQLPQINTCTCTVPSSAVAGSSTTQQSRVVRSAIVIIAR